MTIKPTQRRMLTLGRFDDLLFDCQEFVLGSEIHCATANKIVDLGQVDN